MPRHKKITLFLLGIEGLLVLAAILSGCGYSKLCVKFTASSDGIFELFYADNFKFDSRQSVRTPFSAGENDLSISIPCSKNFDSIRLDPAEKRNVTIKILELCCCCGPFTVRRISAQDLSNCRSFGVERQKSDGHFLFKTTSNDPQISVDLTKIKTSGHFPAFLFFLWLLVLLDAAAIFMVAKKTECVFAFCSALAGKKDRLLSRFPWLSSRYFLYFLWLLLFLIATGFGLTFSSLGALKRDGSDSVQLVGERKILGRYRSIRTDEYIVYGLLPAIDQFNCSPKFPVINSNKGLSGRNYMILHETGIPVRHISMISRPATWGFFLFDLRRGISWNSLFPIFFSVFAFWFMLDTVFPANGRWNFLFALSTLFVSTSAMWSFWPTYNCAGTFLGVAALILLLRSSGWRAALSWGLLMGWSGSVSALTIYFPRVWPGVILAASTFVGWSIVNRKVFLGINAKKLCGFVLGLAFLGFILYEWYDGVRDLIPIVLNSVYPGKRVFLGGNYPLFTLLFGWVAPAYIGQISSSSVSVLVNECEAQSPLLVTTVFVFFLFRVRPLKEQLVFVAISLFIGVVFTFIYVGFPPWLAEVTFFSKFPPNRLYYSISLALILLMAALFSQKRIEPPKYPGLFAFLIMAAAVVPLLGFFSAPRYAVDLVRSDQNSLTGLGIFAVYLFISSVFAVSPKVAIVTYICACIGSGVFYNPLCIAPTQLKMGLLEEAKKEKDQWRYEGRTLFLDGGDVVGPNFYAAVGGKTFNGHFLPEDTMIFDLMLKHLPDPHRFHRQNHLFMYGVPGSAPLIRAYTTAYQGGIYVELNSERYDFSKLPIDYVVTLDPEWATSLKKNRHLGFVGMCRSVARFRVIHLTPKSGLAAEPVGENGRIRRMNRSFTNTNCGAAVRGRP